MLFNWTSVPPASVSFRKWFSWGLLLVLIYAVLAALFWRRAFIDTEAWALYIAGQSFSEQLAQVRTDLVHPPLMYLVQRGWLAAFGQTNNAAHALPLAIVPPAILLLTLLATRITAHWRLLSFFLATLFFQVGGAPTQARMYGLALLLVTAGLLLWDNWRADPRARTLAAWTAVMILLVFTHLFGLLLVFSFVVWNWLQGPRKLAFTLAAAIPGLAYLPWLWYVLPVYLDRGLAYNLTWVHQNLWKAIPVLALSFLGGYQFDSYRCGLIVLAVSALIHFGLLVLLWRNRSRFWPPRSEAGAAQRWFWAAVLLAALPVSILFGFSLVVARAFEARFVLGAMIPYSIALFLLCQLSGRVGRVVLLCLLLPWRIGSVGNSIYLNWEPSGLRTTVEFVAAQARASDLLLMEDPNHSSAFYWEWVRRLHRSERIVVLEDALGNPARIAPIKPTPLAGVNLDGVQRIWLFQSTVENRHRLVAEALATRGFFPVPQGSPGITDIMLFERKLETDN